MFFNKLNKIKHLTTALVTSLLIFSGSSKAQGPIDSVNFSDTNLKACITEHAQTNNWTNTEQVTWLVCHNRNITTLDGIEQFTNLQSLNLIINNIEDLTPVADLTKLVGLALFNNKIKDITPLARLTALQSLSMSYNYINDIRFLGELKQLTYLNLAHNKVSDIWSLNNLTRLKKLALQDNRVTELDALLRLTQLKEINLLNNKRLYCSQVETIQQVLNTAQIQHTCIDTPKIVDVIFADANLRTCVAEQAKENGWTKTTEVESLLCYQQQISSLEGLENFVSLTSLNLGDNQISDISPLSSLYKLKGLGLFFNDITDISPLVDLVDLRGLTFSGNKVHDISVLAGLKLLYNLSLKNNLIDNLTPLAEHPSLRYFDLRFNQLVDLTPLLNVRSLDTLDVRNNPDLECAKITEFQQAITHTEVKQNCNNNGPVVNAGIDQVVTSQGEVTLSGSAVDIDSSGSITTYQWTQIDGTTVELTDSSSNTTTFIAPAVSSAHALSFELTATDNEGAKSSDTIKVFVNPMVSNITANAGPNQAVNQRVKVTLSAAESTGNISHYLWQQTDGPLVTLNNANEATTTFTSPFASAGGPLQFKLTVTDNVQNTQSDVVSVTVLTPPQVEAGIDQNVLSESVVMLNGTAGGSSHQWSQIRGTMVRLTDAQSTNTSFVAPPTASFEILTFILETTTSDGATARDAVYVTVQAQGKVGLLEFNDQTLDECVNFFSHPGTSVSQMTELECGIAHYGDGAIYFRDIADLTGIEQLGALQSLRFTMGNLFEDISPLSQLYNLNELVLNTDKLDDLSPLTSLFNLTSLKIGTSQTLEDITPLSNLLWLTKLTLDYDGLDDVSPLAQMSGLKELSLSNNQIEDLRPLSQLTGLTSLVLSSNPLNDLGPLATLTALETLKLYNAGISDLAVLANFVNLNDLDVKLNTISDIAPLANLKQITELKVTQNRVKEIVVSQTNNTQASDANPDFSHLTALDLNSNQIQSTASIANGDFSRLATLDLSNNPVTDLTGLEGLQMLATVKLNNTAIVNLDPLSTMTSLTELWLDNTNVSDLTPLLRATNLQTISLYNNPQISCEQIQALSNQLPVWIKHNCNDAIPSMDAGPDLIVNEQTELEVTAKIIGEPNQYAHISFRQVEGVAAQFLQTSSSNSVSTISITTPAVTEPTVLVFEAQLTLDWRSITSDTFEITVNPVNAAPVVDAGPDLEVQSQSLVSLNAQASDTDGTITNVQWQQTQGTPVTLNDADTINATFSAPNVIDDTDQVLEFLVTATDNEGSTVSDQITVTVRQVLEPLAANAGADQYVRPQDVVTLSGAGSSSSAVTYKWRWSSGTQLSRVTLSNPDSITTSFTAPLVSGYERITFELAVTDRDGDTRTDYINVFVAEEPITLLTENDFLDSQLKICLKRRFNLPLNPDDISTLWCGEDDLSIEPPKTWDINDLTGIEKLTSMTRLHLPIRNDFEDLTPLSTLTKLTTVELVSNGLFDLSPLNALSQLTTLSIDSNKLTDASALPDLKALTYASFTGNGLTDITGFKQWTNLQRLYLDTPNLNELTPLGQLSSLTSLHLHGMPNKDWSPIGNLDKLQSLTLDFPGTIDLSFTADLLSLQTLVIPFSGITDISALANLVALKKLHLHNNAIKDISVLANKTLLNDVHLSTNQIEDISPLFNLKQLTHPFVIYNRVKEIIPAHAGQVDLSHVIELNLLRNVIESTASVVNADLSALIWLNLEENVIEDISGLETLSHLKTLKLGENLITDLSPLSGLDKLENLYLANNLTSDLSPLYGMNNLKYVDVSNNPNLSCQQIKALEANLSATVNSNCNNASPTIDVGGDQTVDEQTTVTLNIHAQDVDGSIRTIHWQQIAGPIVTWSDVDKFTRKFTAPIVFEKTVISFKIGASDQLGATSWATVSVTVNPVNASPVVYAGADQQVDALEQITLPAQASDADGSIVTYLWQQTAGTTVNLDNFDTTTATFVAPQINATELLAFTFCATDNEQIAACDNVIVGVNPVSNIVTADAGQDQTIDERVLVTLNGSGTTNETTIVKFQWTQVSGTIASLTDTNTATASFTAPSLAQSETLVFALTVTDSNGETDGDYVTITVNPITEIPIVDAGSNQNVVGLAPVTITGSAYDNDGTITDYLWQQISGPTVNLENANTNSATFTTPAVAQPLVYSFELTATDNDGHTGSSTVDIMLSNSVLISSLSFGDDNFKTCVTTAAQTNQWISSDEVTVLDCANQNISSIDGVERLPHLANLNLATNLNLTDISALFSFNTFSSIDLTGNSGIHCSQLATLSHLFPRNVITQPNTCQSSGEILTNITLADASLNSCLIVRAEFKDWTRAEQVTSLYCENANVSDLSGLEQFTGLTQLGLNRNAIKDISALASLEHLTFLDLGQNDIADISPLAKQLTYIKTLDLADNPFNDIAALFGSTPLSADLTGNNQLSCAQLDFLNTDLESGVVLHDECSKNIVDGRLKWRASFETNSNSGMALGADNTLYFVNANHQLTAIDIQGNEAWRFDIKGTAEAPRISPDGTIYVLSSNGNLYAVNPDGSKKWQIRPWLSSGITRAIAADGTIYVSNGKELFAINPDGSQQWMKALDDSINSVRVGVSGQLFIGQSNNTLSLSSNGSELWTSHFSNGVGAIGLNDTQYYITNGVTSAYFGAIDSDGNSLFHQQNASIWFTGPTLSFDGTAYASNSGQGLITLLETGNVSLFSPANVSVFNTTFGNNNTAYVSSSVRTTLSGRLYAIDSNGSVKWSIDSQHLIFDAPLIGSDGTVYFKNQEGIIYAVETNSTGLANSPWPRSGANNGNTNSVNQ